MYLQGDSFSFCWREHVSSFSDSFGVSGVNMQLVTGRFCSGDRAQTWSRDSPLPGTQDSPTHLKCCVKWGVYQLCPLAAPLHFGVNLNRCRVTGIASFGGREKELNFIHSSLQRSLEVPLLYLSLFVVLKCFVSQDK